MSTSRFRAVLALALLAGATMLPGRTPARAADPITVYYYERPPLSMTAENGRASGAFVEATRAAFERAGIPFQFQSASVQRILDLVREGPHDPICSGGWYMTEERARFAKFSKPLYREAPQIGIAAKSLAVPPGTRIADLLAGNTTLVVVDGYSYGRYLDGLIRRKDPRQILRQASNGRTMFELVTSGHADLLLTGEGDLAAGAGLGIGGPDYPILHFPDVPHGETRHIMCDRTVPDAVIDQLNGGIDFPS